MRDQRLAFAFERGYWFIGVGVQLKIWGLGLVMRNSLELATKVAGENGFAMCGSGAGKPGFHTGRARRVLTALEASEVGFYAVDVYVGGQGQTVGMQQLKQFMFLIGRGGPGLYRFEGGEV